MHPHSKPLLIPPFTDKLPEPMVLRTAAVSRDSAYPRHRHPWGELVYSFSGVMHVKVGEHRYLAPSQYALWLPPNIEHQGMNHYETHHLSLYIAPPLSERLPGNICALTVSPLIRALLEHLRDHPEIPPYSESYRRLLHCLLDLLESASCAGSYLPAADDPVLGSILEALEANPGDNRSLQQIAREAHLTERTLIRRCQKELGMTLTEWRQRLRVVKAMDRLQGGEKVESIAYDMGYSTPSAFIAMFHRLTGTTPNGYRKHR
ncbi:MAG: AraC family transcriptional regulator [Gammaproteobacteria bacterium]|nr:AraC family transcriptional regulator [Gammaproteobacteria bacterium]